MSAHAKIPGRDDPGAGGAEGPGMAVPVDPAPPIIWDGLYEDDPIETTYRKVHWGYYGEGDYEVDLPVVESRFQWLADIVWGGCIFGAGLLIGLALGISVGGGW